MQYNIPYFFRKYRKMSRNLSSAAVVIGALAAVVIGALRVKSSF